MINVGIDMLPDALNGSFNTAAKYNPTGGKLYVKAVTNDALTSNEVAMVIMAGSTYLATAPEVSVKGYIGFAADAIASGCVGWVQVRGEVSNCVTAAGSFTGSVGDAVTWGATASAGLHANSSTFHTLDQHVGFLLQEATATTSTKLFLVGKLSNSTTAP
jgi:hypothetical protein